MFELISLSFSAMVLFCLAMDKHRKQVLAQKVSTVVLHSFRPMAWLILLFTMYLSIEQFGWSIGVAVFFGAMTISTLSLILLLTYRAKIVPRVAIVLPLVSSISLMSS
jgi:uncharacterized membrane protein YjjB (DUF3815 family)